MNLELNEDWFHLLYDQFEREYFNDLMLFLEACDIQKKTVYPEKDNIFAALNETPLDEVKVVILGQDPYSNGLANGLAFSSNSEIPKSLKNIFLELEDDLGISVPDYGDLTKWANQGVLLLNSVLTVEQENPGSHANKGWEIFTSEILDYLNYKKKKLVFILWGEKAKELGSTLDKNRHLVLEATHPSPNSAFRGFFGCKHFSKCNNYLEEQGIDKINWDLS